jgi:hypothetical protein
MTTPGVDMANTQCMESIRLEEDQRREKNWKRWGPYLSERQWGTVREDYSATGDAWGYFPHDHARMRAYRWGEDGLLGITDRQCRLCFAVALWNEKDPILKERLFGLTGPEANHGEDVKELYYYLDSTPTHSYMRALYKYPQAAYPYERLITENRARGRADPELEITDTGVFDESRYFDVVAEYAKEGPEDILIRITVTNRGPERRPIHVLPTAWFRNTWIWGCKHEGCWIKPRIELERSGLLRTHHVALGEYDVAFDTSLPGRQGLLFTENETNTLRLYGTESYTRHTKDAFHEALIHGDRAALSPVNRGTKVAPHYRFELGPGEEAVMQLRIFAHDVAPKEPFGPSFDRTFRLRRDEADAFYARRMGSALTADERNVVRQAYAGLLWTKQFYHYVVEDWLEGDRDQPPPPSERKKGRNRDWIHLFNRDVISMPDKWEYPWYAAWDLAFHMIPFSRIDPDFAKEQLMLFLREWFMHPNGQIPAYEFELSDVNPPVHAWAVWRTYKRTGKRGERDHAFLARCFQKLLLNFTWWVNRKDLEGKHLFSGGFLGLDNIGVFDRSRPLPGGGRLDQADGTAWMAFYCTTMLAIALELARVDPVHEDVASKFFEHFVAIADAINSLGGTGLWDETDGFYYDKLHVANQTEPLRVRSMVGLAPLFAVLVLEEKALAELPGFAKRTKWFLENRRDLSRYIAYLETEQGHVHRLLAIPNRDRLERVLRYVFDEDEFLSPYGVRSLSKAHAAKAYAFHLGSETYSVEYVPGESNTGMFGGNSNWRGPIWLPMNFLLIEALEAYHFFYGDSLTVEVPTGSGRRMTLLEAARELQRRLALLFTKDDGGDRPCHGGEGRYRDDPHFRELPLFYEYFHGDTGKGLGASHQTGWTALAINCIEDAAAFRLSSKRVPIETSAVYQFTSGLRPRGA